MASTLAQFDVCIALTTINCGKCGGTYAINERYRQKCYEKGDCWNCPYCKVGWGYANNNENAKLKAQLKAVEEREASLKARATLLEQSREAAWKQAKTERTVRKRTQTILRKTKDRVKNGVCPCCTRHFTNLERHMASKHPGYGEHHDQESVDI